MAFNSIGTQVCVHPKFSRGCDRSIIAANGTASERRVSDEIGFKCWCCFDTGTISHYLLNKYGFMPADLDDPAVQCFATGCMGGYSVEIDSTTGERTTRTKFADGSLDDRMTREQCDFIALAQREEAKTLSEAARQFETFRNSTQPSEELSSNTGKAEPMNDLNEQAIAAAKSLMVIFGDIA
jgi:hypothetical protein